MRPPAYTPTQNNIPVISHKKQCLYASVPLPLGPCHAYSRECEGQIPVQAPLLVPTS